MCTKVTIENEGAAKSGCYSEFQDGREIEVCVCRSTPGDMPCNTGRNSLTSDLTIFTLFCLMCFYLIIYECIWL